MRPMTTPIGGLAQRPLCRGCGGKLFPPQSPLGDNRGEIWMSRKDQNHSVDHEKSREFSD